VALEMRIMSIMSTLAGRLKRADGSFAVTVTVTLTASAKEEMSDNTLEPTLQISKSLPTTKRLRTG
jgi:hypothetical protein